MFPYLQSLTLGHITSIPPLGGGKLTGGVEVGGERERGRERESRGKRGAGRRRIKARGRE